MSLTARVATGPAGGFRPTPVLRSRHPATRGGGRDGEDDTSVRAAADRGGGRLVRVPRGDARPVRDPLLGARAVGLGPPAPAATRHQDTPSKTSTCGRLELST